MELDDARTLARTFMDAYGLDDWDFTFDHAKRRLGQTNFTEKRISLSKHFVQAGDWELVRNTVLHEIAHALVGERHGHDGVWKEQARALGIEPKAATHEAPTVESKYIGTCPNGHTFERHRRPRGLHSCTQCDKKFNRNFLITWRQRY